MTSKTRKRLFFAVYGGLICFFVFGLGYTILSIARPYNSPWPSMLRTEAELRSLQTAIETYRADFGEYPPPGPDGLAKAIAHLSRNVEYYAGGPPLDAWSQPFQYFPAYAYARSDSEALRDDDDNYYAEETFQLYSPGMDGNPGHYETLKQNDNITSWDSERSWRDLYWDRHRKYFQETGVRP